MIKPLSKKFRAPGNWGSIASSEWCIPLSVRKIGELLYVSPMIDHIDIPVSNLEKSLAFYEKAFLPLGFKVSFGAEGRFWAFDLAGMGLFEIHQENSSFTKIHVAFRVQSRDSVHEFYRSAMDAGGRDNGGPGPRPNYTPNYYACFVFDPDGHNIETVHDKWQSEL